FLFFYLHHLQHPDLHSFPTRRSSDLGFNPGIQRGIRIGSARDGSVKYFIPDPCPYPYAAGSSMAEGVTVDAEGNVYGADFLGTIDRKSTRLNSSHLGISYAVFCLKKK